MKKVCLLLIVLVAMLFISGCASLTYKSPDGTEVTYSRFLTGQDSIRGAIKDERTSASINAQGQQNIDPAALQALMGALLTGAGK